MLSEQAKPVRTVEQRNCVFCDVPGDVLYVGQLDKLYPHSDQQRWDIRQCPNCRLLWLDPRPVPEDIPLLYRDYYTHIAPAPEPQNLMRRLRFLVRHYRLLRGLAVVVLRHRPDLFHRTPTLWDLVWLSPDRHGTILDVGCGNGAFLATMRATGWYVAGVEPDSQAAKLARTMFDLSIQATTLEQAVMEPDTFDVARMNQVIEHLDDPVRTLRACYRVLRPGGRIVIATPNALSRAHVRIFHEHWVHLDPPRHLWVFSPEALRIAVEQAGFRVEHLLTSAHGETFTWAMSRKLSSSDKVASPRKEHLQTIWFQLTTFMLDLVQPAGDGLVAIAVKESDR